MRVYGCHGVAPRLGGEPGTARKPLGYVTVAATTSADACLLASGRAACRPIGVAAPAAWFTAGRGPNLRGSQRARARAVQRPLQADRRSPEPTESPRRWRGAPH